MSRLVTIVVSPRERFRPLPQSLRSLFETIEPDVPVIVVDAGCPDHIRDELEAIRLQRPFDLLETSGFVLPSQARNLGLKQVQTKYVAFCDNDLTYTAGWLDTLVANAEDNGSAAVSPVTLIGPCDPVKIHHAGGIVTIVDNGQRRRVHCKHILANVPLPDAEASGFPDAKLDHDHFEYHCVLINTQALRAVGGCDERLIIHEHIDTSLRLLQNGGRLTFEKGSRVMYNAFQPFNSEDWPYFLFRWDSDQAKQSDRVFGGTWGTVCQPDQLGKFAGFHTLRAARTSMPRLPQMLNRSKIRNLLGKIVVAYLRRKHRSAPDMAAAHVPPAPPADALDRASANFSGR